MRFKTVHEWLTWQASLHPSEIELGLERIAPVYKNLVHSRPFTITVAGTNGKGSSVAFLEAILIAAGYRVGSYTSPHLIHYNERIRLQGNDVSNNNLCDAFARVDDARKRTSLSYFEFGTLTALTIFSRSNLDIQILEVGLGGRLDAVNIVDADISMITSIGIDHTDWLGDTREQIGLEKAGVFRPEKPTISGEPNLPDTVLHRAQSICADLKILGVDFNYRVEKERWSWWSDNSRFDGLPHPLLLGEWQFRNAAAVLSAIEQMVSYFPVSEEAIREGLVSAKIPGRLQWLDRNRSILLDVAHNLESTQALVSFLEKRASKGKVFAVFSIMADKDIEQILLSMKTVVSKWLWVPLDFERAADKARIEKAFVCCQMVQPVSGFHNLAEGLTAAQKEASDEDCIVIFGSFYLAAQALTLFKEDL